MNDILTRLGAIGIIPVIKIDDIDKAVPLAKALIDGGIPVAEITFRAAGAEKAIKAITDAFPEMLVGAGTVLTTEQVDRARAAGAKFIVSPGFNPKVVAYCNQLGLPITPGCTTPSEIEQALEMGLEVLKFFPAEQSGGLAKIKALCAPYTQVRFIPTGGVDLKNLTTYLGFDKVHACGGSFMVKADYINNGEFDRITALCRQSIDAMLGFEIAHVGINAANEAEAIAGAKLLGVMLNLPVKVGNSSVFTGTLAEFMKQPGFGRNGHIAIRTNFIERAVANLELRGLAFNPDSKKFNAKGGLNAIYLRDEVCGFAVHLVQK